MKDKKWHQNPVTKFVLAIFGILIIVKWLNIFELLQYLVLIVLTPLAFIGLWCIALMSGGEIGNELYQKVMTAKRQFEEAAKQRAEELGAAVTSTAEEVKETLEASIEGKESA